MEYLKRFNESDYWVDIYGNVYSTKRNETKPLKKRIQSNGYNQVLLCKDGKCKGYLVHRIMALTFLEKPEGKDYINHKDGDKQNNHIENLEWVSFCENVNHAFRTGLMKGGRKLDVDKVRQIRQSSLTTKLLSLIYKVSRKTILTIKKNKSWKEKQ